MDRVEQKLRLSDEEFKRNVGTTKPVFQMMQEILQKAATKIGNNRIIIYTPPVRWTRHKVSLANVLGYLLTAPIPHRSR